MFHLGILKENRLFIIIIPLLTLDGIYSTNASGAGEMPETNNSNHELNRLKGVMNSPLKFLTACKI